MPFRRKAQRRKFAELLMKGEISEETFEEWNRSTGSRKLPERVAPKKKPGRKKSGARKKLVARSLSLAVTRPALRSSKRAAIFTSGVASRM